MLPVVELELDKPTRTQLSPVVILFKHALGILWYATQQPDQVRHLQPELCHRGVVVVGGRFSPNFAELFVLAPVPPLTALENACNANDKTGKGNDSTLSQYLADLGGLVKKASQRYDKLHSDERRTCNWRTYEVPCRLGDRTAHMRDLSMLRAFS